MNCLAVHLDFKQKLRGVGLYGDVCIAASGATHQVLKATLLIIGRRLTLETRQDLVEGALNDLDALSRTQREMLLDLFGKLLAKEDIGDFERAWQAWWKDHGAAAFSLYEAERKA